MNSILFTIGVVIVTVLFGAMFGPYFIDWNGYRSILEAELGDAIGRPVYIDGDMEVRLLPTPYLQARDVGVRSRVSEGSIPLVSAPHIRATVALAPLLRGELKLTELGFDKPVIQVFWHEDGTLEMPGLPDTGSVPIAPDHVSLETVDIRDGTIVLRDEQLAEIKTLSKFNLTGEAGSLSGPFKAEGGVLVDGQIHAFKLATGRLQADGSLKTKLSLRPAGGLYELTADGDFAMPEGRPVYLGKLRLAGGEAEAVSAAMASGDGQGSALPWRFSADLAADSERLAFSSLNIGLGARERAVNLTGNALVELGGERKARFVIDAKQIDVDRALGQQTGEQASVNAGLALLAGALGRAAELPFPVDLEASVDAVVINGGLMEAVELQSKFDGGTVVVDRLAMRLPGKSQFSARGEISGLDSNLVWFGSVSVATRQAGLLIDWLGSDALAFGPVRAKPGASEISLQADIRKSAQSFALSDVALGIDQSAMTGSIIYETGEQERLDINVDVQSFDFDRYFEFAQASGDTGITNGLSGIDQISLRLRADDLVLGGIAARHLVSDLVYSDGALAVTSLSVGDLGGAAVAVEGRIDDPFGAASGSMRASLNAEDLGGVANLLRDLGLLGAIHPPGMEQLDAMAPAALEITLEAAPAVAGTSATLRAEGALAATRLKLDASFAGKIGDSDQGKLGLSVVASNPETHILLRQLGIDARAGNLLDSSVNPAGSIELVLEDALGASSAVRLDVRVMDTRFDFAGTGGMDGSFPAVSGKLAIKGADLRPALSLLELPGSSGLQALDVDLNGSANLVFGKASLDDIRGIVRANTLAGGIDLSWKPGEETPVRVTGKLDLDEVDPEPLLAIFLGDDSFAIDNAANGGTGNLWPERPFNLARIGKVEGDIAFSARKAALPALPRSGETAFRLVMDRHGFELRDITVNVAGGELSGRLAIARKESGAVLNAALNLAGVPLERIIWAPNGRTVASGTGSLGVQMSGEGRSVLGLISSLDGEGTFNVQGGTMRGLDPAAFRRIVAAADAGLDLSDTKVLQVFRGFLAAGVLPYNSFDGVFAINNGVAVARNAALDTEAADVRISALFDLHDMRLSSEWQLAPPSNQQSAVAIPPVAVIFDGPLDRPVRKLDVNALTGFLTVRRLEQDVKRLEEAQADALERQRFDREVRLLTQERIKRIRAARELAAQELERRREEEERLQTESENAPAGDQLEPAPTQLEALPQGISGAFVPPSAAGQLFAPSEIERRALDDIVNEALQDPDGANDGSSLPDNPVTSSGREATGSIRQGAAREPIAPPLNISPRVSSRPPAALPVPQAPASRKWRNDPSAPILPTN